MRLVRSGTFTAVGSRVEVLLEATASVRPAPPELVAFWERYCHPDDGFSGITIMVLIENGSAPALALFERKVADPGREEAEKIAWMRTDVLTHRNEPPLLETCARLLAGPLSKRLKSELVDVLFDYRPGEWFRPGSRDYTPPPASSYSPEARRVLDGIARYALTQLELSERQRAAVKATMETLGPAERR